MSEVPWQIWVVVVILVLEGINNYQAISKQPLAILWLAAKVVFIFGLLKKWKWVYPIFIAIAAIHVVFFAIEGFLIVSLINLALIILVLWAFRYFFPKEVKSFTEEKTL